MEMTVKEFASLGGQATKKKYGKDYFKKLAEKSVAARIKKGQIKAKLSIDKQLAV
jgi:hypothetical protein